MAEQYTEYSIVDLAKKWGKRIDDEQFALLMDAQDELAKFRSKFHIPKAKIFDETPKQEDDQDCLYFCGNSLGLQPKTTK